MLNVGGIEATLGAKVDQKGFREFDAAMAKADKKEATGTLKAKIDRSWREAEDNLKRFDDRLVKLDKTFMVLGGQHVARQSRLFNLFKEPALIAGVAALTQGIALLTGGVVALTSALAPLSGLLVAYPAALTAFGQVAGVVALGGLKDLTEALHGNEQALKRLTPEGRKFMETLKGFQPQFDKLRETVQAPLFEGLEKGLRLAMGSFEPFRKGMKLTSEVMGGLAADAGRLVGSRGFGRDLGRIMKTNALTMRDFGRGGLGLASALRHVLHEARPLTRWMGNLGEALGESANKSAKAGRESGSLRRFFVRTRVVAESLGHTLGNLAGVFGAVGKAAAPLGGKMLFGLERATDDLERLTKSTKGQDSLAKFFEGIEEPLAETGLLVRDIAAAFGQIAVTPGFADLIKQLREELLPVIAQLLEHALEFAPHLVTLIAEVGELASSFIGATGPLVALTDALSFLVDKLNDFFDTVPFVKQAAVQIGGLVAVVTALGGALAAFRFVRWTSDLAGFRKGWQALGKTWRVAIGKEAATNVAGTWLANLVGGLRGGARRVRQTIGRMLGRIGLGGVVSGAGTAAGDAFVTSTVDRVRSSRGRFGRVGRIAGRAIGVGIVAGVALGVVGIGKVILDKITNEITGGDSGWKPPLADQFSDLTETFTHPERLIPHFGGLIREGFAAGGLTRAIRARHPDDNVPAWLTKGEFVLRKKIVDRLGAGRLFALNRGDGFAAGGMVGGFADGDRDATDRTKKMRREVEKEWDHLDKDHEKKTKGMRERTKKRFGDMRDQARGRSKEMARVVGKSMGDLDQALFKGLGYIGDATNKALSAFRAKPLDYSVPTPPGFAGGGRLLGAGRQDTVPLFLGMAAPGEAILNTPQQVEVEAALATMRALGLGRFGSLDELFSAGMTHYAKGGRIRPLDLRGPVPFELPAQGGIDDVRAAANKWIRKHAGSNVYREADRMDKLRRPYLWGGGHGAIADPNGPWDCSGAVSQLLAGSVVPNFTPTVSGGMMGLFQPGRDPEGLNILANPGHVYTVIPTPQGGLRAWGTSGENPGGGAGWIDSYVWRSGFANRHVPLDGVQGFRGGKRGRGDARDPRFARGGRISPHGPVAPALGARWLIAGSMWSPDEVFTGARQLGGSRAAARLLSMKVMGESGGRPGAIQPGGLGRGLLQVDLGQHPEYRNWDLLNPWENLVASLRIYAGNANAWHAPSGRAGHLLWDRIKPTAKQGGKKRKKGGQPGAGATVSAPGDDPLAESLLTGLGPLVFPAAFTDAERAFAMNEPGLTGMGAFEGAVGGVQAQLANLYAQLSAARAAVSRGDSKAAARAGVGGGLFARQQRRRLRRNATRRRRNARRNQSWAEERTGLGGQIEAIEQAILDLTEGRGASIADLAAQYALSVRRGMSIRTAQSPILARAGGFARGGRVGAPVSPSVNLSQPVYLLVEDGAVDAGRIRVLSADEAAKRETTTARTIARHRQFPSATGRVASYGRRRR